MENSDNNFLQDLIIVDEKTKENIALEVVKTGTLEKLYWFSLALSALIATLGLLQNSIPVVIGVMLIAPLLRPIQAFSFAIINTQYKATWKSFKELFFSILLVIGISYLVTWLIPAQLETPEVLSRTNPNILDFFIASTSAVIAFLSLIYKEKLSGSIAGVAMAASLLPPLSVIGIELVYNHYFLAWGGFLLFLTNIVAIVITGILLFFIFGFKPHQEEKSEKFKIHIFILMLITSLISLPLFVSIINLSHQVAEKKYIFDTKKDIFGDNVVLKKIKIKNIYGMKKTEIVLLGEFTGKNNLDFQTMKNELKNKIDKKFDIESKIKLKLINILEF